MAASAPSGFKPPRRAILFALASAALFGVSTPAAKFLLGSIHPILLAGLLYCGAGFGIALVRRVGLRFGSGKSSEVPLRRADIPWLVAAIASGGIAGPILLMFGLGRTDASTASLLLTLEGAATALMAWFVFHENFDRRIAIGMLAIASGAVILGWSGTPSLCNLLGPLAISAACIAWALDNNLTRKVSLSDPLQIVEIKGMVAGPVNLMLGLLAGGTFPSVSITLMAGIVGFLGYGVSLALFVVALRDLGTARTGAYFSTAPFVGAVAAVVFLNEPLTLQLAMAGTLMAIGVWLHVTEHHEHEHMHRRLVHEHSHVHDEHHQHQHLAGELAGEPHTHVHGHLPTKHSHPHMPDMHHDHRH